MDTELFELCKEVYERTGWETKARYYMTLNGKTSIWHWQDAQEFDKSERTPIYNSDYLLEKLPNKLVRDSEGLTDQDFWLTLTPGTDGWYTCYSLNAAAFEIVLGVKSATQLKALLKLVLALKEAGKL